MVLQNHIQDILQLYEYSMAIGKSLKFKDCCHDFLSVLLKRSNFNGALIVNTFNDQIQISFSLPSIPDFYQIGASDYKEIFDAENSFKTGKLPNHWLELLNQNLKEAHYISYQLEANSYLLIYDTSKPFESKLIKQLDPVFKKFSISLKAAKSYEKQQELLVQLSRQNKELNNYTHMVSHDLKSPTRNIHTLASWFIDDLNSINQEEMLSHLENIKDNAEKIDNMVDGIMKYSSINPDFHKLEGLNLNKIIADAVVEVEFPENFTLNIPNYIPSIIGQKPLIYDLFYQLLSNAKKYNDKDDAQVSLSYELHEDEIVFALRDNGKGMESKYYERVFLPFQKLESRAETAGLGLSLAKRIVEVHNGEISIESKEDIETIIRFSLKI